MENLTVELVYLIPGRGFSAIERSILVPAVLDMAARRAYARDIIRGWITAMVAENARLRAEFAGRPDVKVHAPMVPRWFRARGEYGMLAL